MKKYPDFKHAIYDARRLLRVLGQTVRGETWQGMDISKKPEMAMWELFNHDLQVPIRTNDLAVWRTDINPNLPWADRHFEEERVSGKPINPGETYKIWPYGHSASNFLDTRGQFNHSYAERYWPRFAGIYRGGDDKSDGSNFDGHGGGEGIRYRYADLDDLIANLIHDPQTRQAYLPVWFPEDGSHFERKPCSLGYHFIMRNGYFHVNYYIRSCDIIRHFQDDIYLTVRLQLWILDQLKRKSHERWGKVEPGLFTMYITSLHCFMNDLLTLNA